MRPRTSSTLEREAPAMLCMRLCARARCPPNASDTLDNETCESFRELAPLPVPVPVPVPVAADPELVCRDRERGRNAPLIRAREAALPLRERDDEPRSDTRGLDWDEAGDRRPTESSRSRASSEPSGDGWSERDARSWSSSRSEPEPMLSAPRSCWCWCCSLVNAGRVAVRAPAGVGDIGIVPAR